jgi:phosphoribosylformylglycinamidine synthase
VKVTVLVRPKDGILDPQGEAIRQALSTLGYPASSVRAGRLFDVELDVTDPAEAARMGREAADRVLANGLIEGYEVVVEGVVGDDAEEATEEAAGETAEEVAAE